MTTIGFIGLGIMGRPMAKNLQDGGHELYLHSRSGVPEDLLRAGATACGSANDVAGRAHVIILMVPDIPHVEKMLFGTKASPRGCPQARSWST